MVGGFLHPFVIVEDPDSITGYSQYDFGPKSLSDSIYGEGKFVISPAVNPEEWDNAPFYSTLVRIPSTKRADKELRSFARYLKDNPPNYSVGVFNCRHMTTILKNTGIREATRWDEYLPWSDPYDEN